MNTRTTGTSCPVWRLSLFACLALLLCAVEAEAAPAMASPAVAVFADASTVVSNSSSAFDVRAFGAVADYNPATGTGTDNQPFFQKAAEAMAASGGAMYIPAGNWYMGSSNTGNNSFVSVSGNNMRVQCDSGARIYTATGQVNGSYPAVFSFNSHYSQDLSNAGQIAPSAPLAINPVPASGATSVKTTVPSVARTFVAGDEIYLRGTANTDRSGNGELNWVVSADPATGIIVLKYPLIKPYPGTPVNSSGVGATSLTTPGSPGYVATVGVGQTFYLNDGTHTETSIATAWNSKTGVIRLASPTAYSDTTIFPVVLKATGVFFSGLTVDGCEIHTPGDPFWVGETKGVRLINNRLYYSGPRPGGRGMFWNSYPPIYDIEVSNNTIVDFYEQVAEGQQNVRIHDNLWMSNRTDFGLITIDEYSMNVDLHHNTLIYNGNGTNRGVQVVQSYNTHIDSNTIIISQGGALGAGAVSFQAGSSSPCFNCSATNNKIMSTGTYAVGIYAANPGLLISGNIITANGTGINGVLNGSTVSANQITLHCSSPNCHGITVGGHGIAGGHGAHIFGNTVDGVTAASNIDGVYISAETGPFADSASIVGNRFSNVNSAVTYNATDDPSPMIASNQCDSTVTNASTTCGPAAFKPAARGPIAVVAPKTTTGAGFQATTMYTTDALTGAGQYRMCSTISITVAGTGGSYSVGTFWIGDTHAYSVTSVSSLVSTSQWGQNNGCITFYADAGAAIKYNVQGSGINGSPKCRYAVTLERLQ